MAEDTKTTPQQQGMLIILIYIKIFIQNIFIQNCPYESILCMKITQIMVIT